MVGTGRPKPAVQFPNSVTVLHCPFLNCWNVLAYRKMGLAASTITPVSGLQPVGELFLLTSPFIDQVNGNSLSFDAKTILASTANQWNLPEIS